VTSAAVRRILVDGNNVMGAAADGWWRDRRGAARRLLARVQQYAATTDATVELVFDIPDPDLAEGDHDGVVLRYATRSGRDAGDDRIRALLAEGDDTRVEVVTSDRALAASARDAGATVTGAGTFLARLRETEA
jgi:predicted RNA-binding protein with PIN domain